MRFVLLIAVLLPLVLCHRRHKASLLASRSDDPAECNAKESHDVVIVGAGISGLVAATELYWNYDVKDLVIIEARDRIGGRVYTQRNEDKSYIEIGAQYVHGEVGNAAWQFAEANGLAVPRRDRPDGEKIWYDLNGEEVDYRSVVRPTEGAYDDSYDAVTHRRNESVGYQLKKNFADWLAENSQKKREKQAVFDFLYNEERTETGDDLLLLSPEQNYEYFDAKGDQAAYIKNGWSSVVEKLVEGFPIEKLTRFESVVSSINYDVTCDGRKRVAVILTNGDVYLGKTAIVTLSLGVLKAGTVQFQPPLPAAKQTAIDRLGFGCTAKVFLFFDEPWWTKELNDVNAVFVDGLDDGIKITRSLYASDRESLWYREITGFNTVFGHNLVLQGWLTGEWARLSEKLPLVEVESVVNQILHKAFKKDFSWIRNATRVMKSDWCNDPLTMGVYSYVPMGAKAEDHEKLAAPLPEGRGRKVLFFAGEATSKKQWASVHGAWNSGWNVAAEVAKAMDW